MAFCTRSERNIIFDKKEQFPGPGQYIKLSPRIILNNKRKFPPFFTSAKRASFVNVNDIPGPGSYNLIEKNHKQNISQLNLQMQTTNTSNEKEKDENNFHEIITNFNKAEKGNNLSTIYQFSSYSNSSKLNNNNISSKNPSFISKDKAVQNSKIFKIYNNFDNNINNKFIGNNIGFLSQANRFDNLNKEELYMPGPGAYYESILSSRAKTNNKLKNKIKNGNIFDKSGSLSRIISIPSKNMNGYIFKSIEGEKAKSNNNSIIKNSEGNNNSSFSSLKSKNNIFNKEKNNILKGCFDPNIIMDYKDENKIFENKCQLLINERKFGSTANTTTSEFVGPGTYDVSLIEKKNNVINWSKGFNLEKISKKNNILKKAKLLEELKKNGESTPVLQTFHGKINKITPNQRKILLLFSLRKIKNNILQNKIPNTYRDSFIPDKTQIPGPGYYDKDIFPFNKIKNAKTLTLENDNSKKLPNLNYIKYHFSNKYNSNKMELGFGSNCERDINKAKSLEDLGPFTYFQEKNKFDPGKKNTLHDKIILGKTDISRTVYNNCDFYSPDITNESQENDKINFDSNLGNKNNDLKINNIEKYNKNKKAENLKYKNTLSNLSTDSDKAVLKKLDISGRNFFSKLNQIPLVDLDRYKYFYNNPGPGDYNLEQKFIKKSFSTNQMMQTNSERFKEKIIDENPGPGAYQLGKNFDKKILLKKITFKKSKTELIKEQKIKKIIERNKKRNETPGVGLYNLDFKNSLVYKVRSKYNKSQGYNSPFLISSSRFTRKINNNEVSSADYDPYKFENTQKNNQFMVFNKAERFSKDDELIVGPGSYQLKTQWNKKTFNKLFSPLKNKKK